MHAGCGSSPPRDVARPSGGASGVSVWVVPVPDGYTVDDALMEINVFGHLVDRVVEENGVGGSWVAVEVDD